VEERRDIAGDETPDTDRVLTVPNALSVLRLLGVPLFLWLLLRGDDGWALVTLALSGITDYLDGKIARHFHLVSRVGQLLDPIADRLYIVSTLLGMAWRDIIPWWIVWVLLLRELFMAGLLLALKRVGQIGLPVHFVGKGATLNLLYAFPVILLGQVPGHGRRVGAAHRLGVRVVGDRPLLGRRRPVCRPGRSRCCADPGEGRMSPRRVDESMALITELREGSLEAGYAAASARRVAEGQPSHTSTRSPLVIAFAVIVGFLLVVSAMALRSATSVVEQARAELIGQITARQEAGDALAEKVSALEAEVAGARSAALGASGQSGVLSQLAFLQSVTGVVAVTGPGLTVTLDDSADAVSGADAARGFQRLRSGARERRRPADRQQRAVGGWRRSHLDQRAAPDHPVSHPVRRTGHPRRLPAVGAALRRDGDRRCQGPAERRSGRRRPAVTSSRSRTTTASPSLSPAERFPDLPGGRGPAP
jgi:cardiolipin synthase